MKLNPVEMSCLFFSFQQWTFLHQNLTRNLKIIGPQSGKFFSWRSNVIYNDVIFSTLHSGSCLKNKVLVHFCAFLYATFNFEYNFSDITTTLNVKVLEYSPEGNHIGKMENFGDIWWLSLSLASSVSLNLIWILRGNFTTS